MREVDVAQVAGFKKVISLKEFRNRGQLERGHTQISLLKKQTFKNNEKKLKKSIFNTHIGYLVT